MEYQQQQIDEEFHGLAMAAVQCVHETGGAAPGSASADKHDQSLAELSVYGFLSAKPFLQSREAMLKELKWFRDAAESLPANVIDANRFTSSVHSLVRQLIHRFERVESPYWMRVVAA
jgi:hypothetical protein